MIGKSQHRTDKLRVHLISLLALLTAVGVGIFSTPAAQAATPPTAAQPAARHDAGPVVGPARGLHRLPAPQVAGRNASFTSTNWDGYAVTNTAGTNTTAFDSVSATWVQPAVTCNASGSLGSTWVGFDGFLPASVSVEQGGSSAQCINTVTPSCFLWWEMFPFNGEQDTVQINAGDTIHGSVTFDTVNNVFDIVVTDETLGQGLSESVPCEPDTGGCLRSSAEVISEDTGGADNIDGLFSLPNYGTDTFTNAGVTDVNGNTGTLSNPNWATDNITEVSSEGITKQTVGALSPDGSSFGTAWQQYEGDGITVQVDYRALSTAATTPEPDIDLDVVDTGTNPVDLAQIVPEYWFSDEDPASPLEFACDFAAVGCANISATFLVGVGTPATANTEVVLRIAGTGTLEPGQHTGPIEFRIFHQDFSQMTQTNDYSFNAADTRLTPNPFVDSLVVGEGGEANWGVPAPSDF
ncbi:MAG TPA: cellulose binding domain-containing protein [Actinocrinis sp.]